MNEELEPFIDPKHVSYEESSIPGYKIPVHKAVLSLRPKTRTVSVAFDDMWEIIKEVAENDTTFRRHWGAYECPFCHVIHDVSDNFQHDETCIVTKARSLVCEMEGKKDEQSTVVFPVPPIEVWNALVAEVGKSASTHPYKNIAMNVLSEMRKYTGYTYAVGFKTPVDIERLAIAIQRFVEQEG